MYTINFVNKQKYAKHIIFGYTTIEKTFKIRLVCIDKFYEIKTLIENFLLLVYINWRYDKHYL